MRFGDKNAANFTVNSTADKLPGSAGTNGTTVDVTVIAGRQSLRREQMHYRRPAITCSAQLRIRNGRHKVDITAPGLQV